MKLKYDLDELHESYSYGYAFNCSTEVELEYGMVIKNSIKCPFGVRAPDDPKKIINLTSVRCYKCKNFVSVDKKQCVSSGRWEGCYEVFDICCKMEQKIKILKEIESI